MGENPLTQSRLGKWLDDYFIPSKVFYEGMGEIKPEKVGILSTTDGIFSTNNQPSELLDE